MAKKLTEARAATVTESLASFDALPDSAMVQARTVAGMLGVSQATIWRWAKNGVLTPRKIPGGRATRFSVGEIRPLLTA